jgi:hypothetical protein
VINLTQPKPVPNKPRGQDQIQRLGNGTASGCGSNLCGRAKTGGDHVRGIQGVFAYGRRILSGITRLIDLWFGVPRVSAAASGGPLGFALIALAGLVALGLKRRCKKSGSPRATLTRELPDEPAPCHAGMLQAESKTHCNCGGPFRFMAFWDGGSDAARATRR